jgi:hypothetical protein
MPRPLLSPGLTDPVTGKAAVGAQIHVYISGTNTLAPLYQPDDVTMAPNPLTADEFGRLAFRVDIGTYDLKAISRAGGPEIWVREIPAVNPMATGRTIIARGDLAVGDVDGVATRLPVGQANTVLASDGRDPTWAFEPTVRGFRLTAAGGHDYLLEAGGTGSTWPGSILLHDLTLARTILRIDEGGAIFLNITGDGLRSLGLGAVNSGGAGFRMIRASNDPGI